MIREYGYEYDAFVKEELWKKTKGAVTHDCLWGALCLRSGRDALKTIAREYKKTSSQPYPPSENTKNTILL